MPRGPGPHPPLQAAQTVAERKAEEAREERAKLAREAEGAAADAAAAHEAFIARMQAEADRAQVCPGVLGGPPEYSANRLVRTELPALLCLL